MTENNKGNDAPRVGELVRLGELQNRLAHIFPSRGSLDWEIRQHRDDYVAGGALYELAGRLMAHPYRFERVALEIGARKLKGRRAG